MIFVLVGPVFTGNTDDQVVAVACARDHTVILTNPGTVYTMGGFDGGKLGHGDQEVDSRIPKLVERLLIHTIAQIAAGDM